MIINKDYKAYLTLMNEEPRANTAMGILQIIGGAFIMAFIIWLFLTGLFLL